MIKTKKTKEIQLEFTALKVKTSGCIIPDETRPKAASVEKPEARKTFREWWFQVH